MVTEKAFLGDDIIYKIINFLGKFEGRLQQLSLESGILPMQLYQGLLDPNVQAGVMDFLLNNELLLVEFCQEQDRVPSEVWKIRLQLPGAPC